MESDDRGAAKMVRSIEVGYAAVKYLKQLGQAYSLGKVEDLYVHDAVIIDSENTANNFPFTVGEKDRSSRISWREQCNVGVPISIVHDI